MEPKFTFRKGFVYAGDKLVGSVRKVEGRTVRGAPVRWEAWRKGRCLGSAPTRHAAAALLTSQ